MILRRKACVCQVAWHLRPFVQSTVIKHLQFLRDDKGDDIVLQAFLEHDQPSDTSVAILKRMYQFKALVEVKDILQAHGLFYPVFFQ